MKTMDQLIAELAVRERCDFYLMIAMLMALMTFTAPMALALIGQPLSFELSWAMLVGGLKAMLGLAALQVVTNIWLY